VSVTGYGDTGNDLATSFRWTTQTDSTHITPATGTVGFMGPPMERDDPVVAFGPSLLLSGLPDEAADPVAELVLPDAPGAPSYPMDLRPDQCRHDGVLDFEGRTKAGDEVDLPPLGDPPYRTEVRVTLAGTTYVGTASWPEDLQPRNSNSLQLHWSPPLPTGF
jgi:hypothetical protein